MSKKFYFHSLTITNFRLFRQLDIPKMKRINVIGGFNGSGKSGLLETLFFLVDLRNPLCLIRPFGWRKTSISGEDGLDMLFQDQASPAEITFKSEKLQTLKIERSTLPENAISAISANLMPSISSGGSSVLTREGLRISVGDTSTGFESFLIPHGDGYAGTITRFSDLQFPACQMLSATLMPMGPELAEWLSDCVKQNRLDVVIEHLRILDPSVNDLIILQGPGGPAIFAKRKSGMIRVELLGGGFVSLLATLLTIFRYKNSVVLLDEIDTALHYSVAPKFWEIVSQAATEVDCQIFATSHSREAILNAASGVERAGNKLDFQYLRLEREGDAHQAICYSYEDIVLASNHGFEFR
jgi:hypothetical protein